MASSTSDGLQDRRGFDFAIKASLVAIPLTIVVLLFYSYLLGLVLFLASCLTFITLESVSSPPQNNPVSFVRWARGQDRRRPVLACVGASLTQGTCSASITSEIPTKLREGLGMNPPDEQTFCDPLWVVNFGQNGITAGAFLKEERLNAVLGCYPDYILVWIGTNDIMSVYSERYANRIVRINGLTSTPTMQSYERDLTGILNFIQGASPTVRVGLCTLPPAGEDLKSEANKYIREANGIIQRIADAYGERCSVVDVFGRFEAILEKSQKGKGWSVEYFGIAACIINPLFHIMPGLFTWNALSRIFGYTLLLDGIHLNDRGRDEVVDLIVEWLLQANVAKAIAAKST